MTLQVAITQTRIYYWLDLRVRLGNDGWWWTIYEDIIVKWRTFLRLSLDHPFRWPLLNKAGWLRWKRRCFSRWSAGQSLGKYTTRFVTSNLTDIFRMQHIIETERVFQWSKQDRCCIACPITVNLFTDCNRRLKKELLLTASKTA